MWNLLGGVKTNIWCLRLRGVLRRTISMGRLPGLGARKKKPGKVPNENHSDELKWETGKKSERNQENMTFGDALDYKKPGA